MDEKPEDLTTIHFFNRQSIAKRWFLFLSGLVLLTGGATGSVWSTMQFLEEGTVATTAGAVGLASVLGVVVGGLLMHQSRFEYTDTTAS